MLTENRSIIRARIDSDIKEQATKALSAMGLSMSEALRLFMFRIAKEQRFPFDLKVPNKETQEAIKELESGGGHRYETVEEMWKDLQDD